VTRLEALLAHSGSEPLAVVCADGERRLTWRDLSIRCGAVAQELRKSPAAEPVLATDDPFDFLAALLACWAADRTPVVPSNLQPGTLAQFALGDRVLLDERWLKNVARVTDESSFPPAPDAAVTLYTSGSSGDAKAITKTLAQLAAEVDVLEAVWGARLGDATLLATVPHHHLYGLLFRLMWPLATSRPFDRRACLDADQLLAAVARHPRHALISSPSHLARLPQLLSFDRWSPRPRALFSSGAPIDAATAALYLTEFSQAPIEVLGSTESGGIAHRQWDGNPAREAWTPLPAVEIARAEDGALVVSSPWSGGPCRLEDQISVDSRGGFRLGARMDRIVKLEGKRVSLPEIEARIGSHPWIAAAAVELVPEIGRLGAVLVLTDEGRASMERGGRPLISRTVREHVVAGTDRVAVPRRYRVARQLPLNDRGKIDRMALLALLRNDDESLA
jgi:acyl-coenzyme A synthetase/AMP-(fatty) acid ligase